MSDLATLSLAWIRDPYHVDLTTRQWAMLAVICDTRGPHTVKALSEHLKVSKPVVTRMHTTLAKMGLVVRSVDRRDLRLVSIDPTKVGRKLREHARRGRAGLDRPYTDAELSNMRTGGMG